jgi:acetyl esterase/lipase
MIPYNELAATPAPPADHREAYGTGPQQFGELRLPRGHARVPIVVLVHGGCWRAQYDLAHTAAAAAAIASAGYAVWAPEYRRVGDPGGGWPGTFDDVGQAIDFLRTLAAKYSRLDTTRVVLAGHSAGGQLVLWAASRRAGEMGTVSGTLPLRVSGVVGLAAISDMEGYARPNGCGSAVMPLMGGRSADVPDRYRAVSPIERLPLGIPVRLVHGVADPIVPIAQSRGFVDKASGAGSPVTLTEVPGAGHFDVIAPQCTAWSSVLAAIRGLVQGV